MFLISEEKLREMLLSVVKSAALDWDFVPIDEQDAEEQLIVDEHINEFKKNNKQNVPTRDSTS